METNSTDFFLSFIAALLFIGLFEFIIIAVYSRWGFVSIAFGGFYHAVVGTYRFITIPLFCLKFVSLFTDYAISLDN